MFPLNGSCLIRRLIRRSTYFLPLKSLEDGTRSGSKSCPWRLQVVLENTFRPDNLEFAWGRAPHNNFIIIFW